MKLINKVKILFGLKGSWIWACKQMELMQIVRRKSDISCKYRLSIDKSNRIMWAFTHELKSADWKTANIFLRDIYATDYEIWNGENTLKEVIKRCHMRSAVRRKSKPNKKYWKNHTTSIMDRVPEEDKKATDWEEYDPRDDSNQSIYG
jgi:hypothetical protein